MKKKPTAHEEVWPPRPPWGEPEESAAKIVAKGLIGGLLGLPLLLGAMALEARDHFKLKL